MKITPEKELPFDWTGRDEYDHRGVMIKKRRVEVVEVPNYTQYTDYKGESGSILSRENTQSQIEILPQALQQLQAHVFRK